MPKKTIANVFIVAAVIMAMIFAVIIVFCDAKTHQEDSKAPVAKSDTPQSTHRPLIIWWGRLQDNPEILRLAISSGVFSHVMLVTLHEFDKPMNGLIADPNFKMALKLCKEKGVKIVWTRWLYPGYRFKDLTVKDVFEARYYVQQIRNIRDEAKRIGVDLVAFDAEPYANSQLMGLKTLVRNKLSEREFEALNDAIGAATAIEGQVDFVLPAGTRFGRHLYDAARRLGKLAISEHTYYDVPQRRKGKREYDIFGAYVSTSKKNKLHPKLTLFTPNEILSRQELWAHKKGLFIYPGSAKNAAAIALEFSKIRTTYPAQDSNGVR